MLIKGIILGIVIVLPGMSGGTVLLILGLYEMIIRDMVELKIRPYLPLLYGTVGGIFASSMIFGFFFESYESETLAFLLGCLLASIRSVLNNCPKLNLVRGVFLIGGLLIGLVAVGEPIELMSYNTDINWILLFVGGALASAAMIIPGIPGSSVLILMGIYDDVLVYLKEFKIIPLLVFLVGGVIGILSLVKLMDNIYKRYRAYVSYFFAGIILGSSRASLPSTVSLSIVLAFLVGFILIWVFGKDKDNANMISGN